MKILCFFQIYFGRWQPRAVTFIRLIETERWVPQNYLNTHLMHTSAMERCQADKEHGMRSITATVLLED